MLGIVDLMTGKEAREEDAISLGSLDGDEDEDYTNVEYNLYAMSVSTELSEC
jgi:hypothetical protein